MSSEASITVADAGPSLALPIPIRDGDLFKHAASAHVVNFLADNPSVTVSIRQLSRVTPTTDRATRAAVDVLDANGLVETDRTGTAIQVGINRERLHDPGDPIQRIPQVPFRTPVRVARHYVEDELDDVLGVVLFGSVARGAADRRSDIDLWILVDGTSGDLLEQRNRATKLAGRLSELQIPPKVALAESQEVDFASRWPEIRARLEADDREWASAERHSVEFVVETPQSILAQSTRVDPERLFGEGITLVTTETLRRVKLEVLADE